MLVYPTSYYYMRSVIFHLNANALFFLLCCMLQRSRLIEKWKFPSYSCLCPHNLIRLGFACHATAWRRDFFLRCRNYSFTFFFGHNIQYAASRLCAHIGNTTNHVHWLLTFLLCARNMFHGFICCTFHPRVVKVHGNVLQIVDGMENSFSVFFSIDFGSWL